MYLETRDNVRLAKWSDKLAPVSGLYKPLEPLIGMAQEGMWQGVDIGSKLLNIWGELYL